MNRCFYIVLCFFISIQSFAQGSRALVAHWKFSGNANDSSGHGLNGIATGTTSAAGFNGIPNTALRFNGSSDKIDVPYDPSMNLDSFSICALIKPSGYYSGTCQGNFILMRAHESDSSAYCLQFNDEVYDHNDCLMFEPAKEQFVCEAHAGGPGWPAGFAGGPYVDTGEWYCVVATFDGDSARIYVDGVEVGAIHYDDGYSPSGDPLGIGYYHIGTLYGYPYWFNGIIDDIRLYGRALSGQEATQYCDTAKMLPPVITHVSVTGADTGCGTFEFNAYGDTAAITMYNWDFGDGSTATGHPVWHTYGAAGSYTVTLIATDTSGNSDTATYSVHIYTVGNISLSGDTIICKDESAHLHATGSVTYMWSPAYKLDNPHSSDPVATPDTSIIYYVTGLDSNQCSHSDSIYVRVTDCTAHIGVPGGFSPNGDGSNDILYVRGNNIKSIHFLVFDRWGLKVFETDNMNIGWDGTYNGKPQPIDTYCYILEAVTIKGDNREKKGNVTLLR